MTNVFDYLEDYKVEGRSTYPYTDTNGKCKHNSKKGLYSIEDYYQIKSNDPTAHIAALQRGPVSVAMDASGRLFAFYSSGIISSNACGTSLNHAVNLVGYGTSSGKPYWIVRNSWGTNWGEAGYFRL